MSNAQSEKNKEQTGPITLFHGTNLGTDLGTGGEAGESAPASVFLTNIAEIRNRVRQNIMSGAVTPDYKGDLKLTIAILNEALATEIVCTLRYRNHFHLAEGIEAQSVAQEFLEHSNEELNHAELIAKRIRELNGEPDYNPANLLSRSHSEYQTGATLTEMLQEDLIAERIAIESYREIVRYFAPHDPTSRRMMEDILAREEEHAEEIQTLLSQTSWKSKEHLRQSFEESGEIDESESTEGRSA